jgi:hypothetical protein
MNILSFVRRVLLALVAGAALCGGSIAIANSVTLIPTGFAAGSESLDFTGEPFSPVSAGAFAGTLDGNPIVFFCFELTQTFNFNPSPGYTYDDSIPSGPKFTALSELFTEGFATALSSTDFSVGFQLAVWEILMETTPASVSTGNGSFYVTNDHGNTGAVTRANDLLAGLPATGLYTIHLLTNDSHQDFVYGTLPLRQVPEPAPLMLIGAAMVALFVMRRRIVATRIG